MTTYNKELTTTQDKFICQAIKKDGKACKYKAQCGSLYCGVHKKFIDTSKTLHTEEEAKKGTYKFMSMTGNNYEITQDTPTLQVNAIKEIKRKYKIDFMTDVLIFEEGKEEPLRKNAMIYADANNLFVVEQIKAELKEEIESVEPYILELLKYSIKNKIEKLKKTPTKVQFNILYNEIHKYNYYLLHTNALNYDMTYRLSSFFVSALKKIYALKHNLNGKYKFGWAYEAEEIMETIFNRIITTNKLDQYETYY